MYIKNKMAVKYLILLRGRINTPTCELARRLLSVIVRRYGSRDAMAVSLCLQVIIAQVTDI